MVQKAIGLVLGTDPNSCDVVLPLLTGISPRHSYVTFDSQRRSVLRDCSSVGTMVTYDGKRCQKRGQNIPRILSGQEFPDKAETVVVQIHKDFRIQSVVARPMFPEMYFDKVDGLMNKTLAAADILSAL